MKSCFCLLKTILFKLRNLFQYKNTDNLFFDQIKALGIWPKSYNVYSGFILLVLNLLD